MADADVHAFLPSKKCREILLAKKSANIDEFYHAQLDFDHPSSEARRHETICGTLHEALHGRPRIVGHYLIHLLLLADSLLEDYAHGWEYHTG